MKGLRVALAGALWVLGTLPSYGGDARLALSLDDLGFSKEETRSDPQLQKDLEVRSDMLRIHQTLGLINCVPMVATYTMGLINAGAADPDTDLHMGLGLTTATLYATTACFSVFAPKPKGLKSKGNSELHQVLAVVHGAFMIATPILGGLARQEESLETLHLASATGLVTSYLTAMAVMTF